MTLNTQFSIGISDTKGDDPKHVHSAARMITGTKKFSHIMPVLVNLHWLPVDYRVKFKLLCLTYKALHGLAPAYLSDLLQQYSSQSLFDQQSMSCSASWKSAPKKMVNGPLLMQLQSYTMSSPLV